MRPRGVGIVELLVASTLGFIALAGLTAALATGARLLAAAGRRGEVEDTAQLAIEAFTFDARRAGYDPGAVGIEPLGLAEPGRIGFDADLDGDGVLNASSEEHTTYVCSAGAARLSRLVGAQSLPVADGVTACAFRYLDGAGAPIVAPATGLLAAERARVRRVALDLAVGAAGDSPAVRVIEIALRTRP